VVSFTGEEGDGNPVTAAGLPTRPRVVAWGEVLWDLFEDGPRLGGAAANVAYHAAQLGVDAALVSRVGTDELGARACAKLALSGVDVSLIQRDPGAATGTVAVTMDRGEPRYRIATEVAWDRIAGDESVLRAVSRADVLCFGTLAQRTVLGAGALRAAWDAARPGCLRVCDLNVRPPFAAPAVIDAAVAHADVVKLNEAEAALVAREAGVTDAVDWLLGRGVRLVALTRGARGCALVTAAARVEHPGYPVAAGVGDPVGAGDAFVAVLAVELGRARAIPDELSSLAARANRIASHVASCPGAMPPIPAWLASS